MSNYNYGGGYPGGYQGPPGGAPQRPGYNAGGFGFNPPPGGPAGYNPSPGGPAGYNPPPGGPAGYNPPPQGQGGYNPQVGGPGGQGGYNPQIGGPGGNPRPSGQFGQQQGWAGQQPPQQGGMDQNIVQWFHAVDRDRTGKITANELQMALTNSNWTKFNIDTCKLMITMFDRDKSGQIDLNEFQALWAYIHQWKAIFDQFDNDRSGSIDANELHNAYLQMGYRLSPQFSQSVVNRFDMAGQHKISLDYFIHSCVLIKSVTDQFRVKDAANTGLIQVGYEDFLSAVVLNRI